MNDQDKISIEQYSSFESFGGIRDQWDAIVEETTSSIFQTYDWCRIWWNYYGAGRKLIILLFRRGGRLIGVLPLFTERLWIGPISLTVIKRVNSDFTYSTAWPAIEEPCFEEVFRLTFEQMSQNCRWDVFLLDCFPGLFNQHVEKLHGVIQEALPAGFDVRQIGTREQTYFLLPGSFDQYIQKLDKKKQHELRRKKRIFDEAAGSPDSLNSRLVPQDETVAVFEAFYQAHQDYWHKQNHCGHFGDWPKSRDFHAELARTMADLGYLRLLEVRCGNEPIGYKYAYRCGKVLVEFLDARADDPRFARASLGNIIFLEQVKWACQEGIEHIDSLIGRYEHKLQMGGKVLLSRSLLICRKSSQLRFHLFRRLAVLINAIYYKAWFCRIRPRLGVRSGSLSKLWIRSHMFAQ